jgi:hypothetical protein
MKMANKGYNPAYNVQFATTNKTQIIVGVNISNSGNDYGQISVMMQQIKKRYNKMPNKWLADPGYRALNDIEKAYKLNPSCEIYIPLMESKNKDTSSNKESKPISEWRKRMEQNEANIIYRQRAATSECVNAIARNRGLQQFLVRGMQKAYCVCLIFAIAHNMMRAFSL